MSSFLFRSKILVASLIPKQMSFRQACGASVVLHAMFVLAFALLLRFLDVPNLYEPPLVLDFVFAPSDSHLDSDDSGNETQPGNDKAGSNHTTENKVTEAEQHQSYVEELPRPATELRKPAPRKVVNLQDVPQVPVNEGGSVAEAGGASDQPLGKRRPHFDQTHLVSTIKPTSFLRPKTTFDLTRSVAAKIPLSKKERKMFRKKIRKWAQDFQKLDLRDSTLVWRQNDRQYSAKFRRVLPGSKTDIEQVVVQIETEEAGVDLVTEMRMKRLAFSNFAQFVDFWDPWVAVHDDVMEGRFHANSKINILDNRGVKPRFYGKVTTASFDINTASRRPFFDDKAIFVGGLETGVKAIKLPKTFLPFLADSTVSSALMRSFGVETKITFHADGSYSWWPVGSEQPPQKQSLPKREAYYIVGSKKKSLHLSGVVNGKVLVYSPGKIVIDGDLTYASHPEASNLADDYLGIVSDQDVEIAHPSVTGSGDLNIYAAIYAKRRFVVRHLNGRGDDTLLIYGSLSAGSISATEPRYGTRIRFDKRLESNRPPSFPMTDRYEVSQWDGKWQLQGN